MLLVACNLFTSLHLYTLHLIYKKGQFVIVSTYTPSIPTSVKMLNTPRQEKVPTTTAVCSES